MTTATCNDCRYCLNIDYGYSIYTVEGTTSYCLLKLNPSMPSDRAWGLDPSHQFAAQCPRFSPGESVHVDVDHDRSDLENSSDDPEIVALLKEFDQ